MKAKILSLILALGLLTGVSIPASAQNFSSVQVLNGSCAAPAFTFNNDPDSGFYLVAAGTIAICINGAEVGRITSNGLQSGVSTAPVQVKQSTGQVLASTSSYADAASFQAVSGDVNIAAAGGSSAAATPSYLGGVMGNAIGGASNLAATQSIVAGVIGKIDHTGTNSSNYPSAGVIAEVGDKAANVDGAFIAAFGGDSGAMAVTGAFYGVSWWNSTVGNAIDFGLDLEGKAVAGNSYIATPRYAIAPIRLGGRYSNAGTVETTNDVCILVGTAAPTDGTSGTGAAACGAGSLYIRQSGASSTLHQNTNTKASPTWTAK